MSNPKLKILIVDIETSPLLVWTWGLFDQFIGLEQIKEDWRIISFAAKWEDSKEIIQKDLRNGINDRNEKAMLKTLWNLLNKADIVVGQNSKRFDVKKINEKFLFYDLGKPSEYRQEDTLIMSKKYFSPTSHKLEYRSNQLNKKYKKLSHSKYPGFSLWKACMNNDQKAWNSMAEYNTFDVLSTEEYYKTLKPWASKINHAVLNNSLEIQCTCGSPHIQKRGYNYTNTGKFRKYQCTNCAAWLQGKENLLDKNKKKSLLT
jgi:hypothetical protein